MNRTESSINYTIQGCRGLAILMVFLFHAWGETIAKGWIHISHGNNLWYYLSISGASGVDIFFIISGYLAVSSIKNANSFFTYLYKRIIRIYPVYIILLVFTFCVGPLFPHNFLSHISLKDFILSFLFNLTLFPTIFYKPNAILVTWALSYIFLFYVLWGIFYRSFVNIRESIGFIIIFILSLCGFALFVHFHPQAIFFIIGILVHRTEPFIKYHLKDWNIYSIFTLTALLMMISLLAVSKYINANAHLIFMSSLFGYVFFLLVITFDSLFSTFLQSPPLIFVGNISYSFFLIHPFVLYVFKKLFAHFHPLDYNRFVLSLSFIITSFFVSILLGWILFDLIEVKFTNKYLRKS